MMQSLDFSGICCSCCKCVCVFFGKFVQLWIQLFCISAMNARTVECIRLRWHLWVAPSYHVPPIMPPTLQTSRHPRSTGICPVVVFCCFCFCTMLNKLNICFTRYFGVVVVVGFVVFPMISCNFTLWPFVFSDKCRVSLDRHYNSSNNNVPCEPKYNCY